MVTKKEVATFTLKTIYGGAKGGVKITYKTVKFTVKKSHERNTKKRLERLERLRKMIIVTLDGLKDSRTSEEQKKQARKVVAENESAVLNLIATLNHDGFGIRYKGNGVIEYEDTDATD